MSMGMVLEGVRDWLRNRNDWKVHECGVSDQCYPFLRSGQFFVGIDEDGENAGDPKTYALTEVFQIEVGVWRRPGHLTRDFYDQMVVPEDRYLPEIRTLHDFERRVKFWLHHKWEMLPYLNTKYGLPDSGRGDKFTEPLTWAGTSKKQTYIADDKGQVAYIGRRLRFRGLKRIQKISNDLG